MMIVMQPRAEAADVEAVRARLALTGVHVVVMPGELTTAIVDPRHAAGDRRLVQPMSRAATAIGADGILVEVHQDPEHARCDGPQSLHATDFSAFARDVAAHAELAGKRLA